jgi:uncharacterized membrane protein
MGNIGGNLMEVWEIFLLPWQYWAMLCFGIGVSFLGWYIKKYKDKFDFLPKIINILNMVSSIIYALFVDNLMKNYGKYMYETSTKEAVDESLTVLTTSPNTEIVATQMVETFNTKVTFYNNLIMAINIVFIVIIVMIAVYFLRKKD